MLAGEAAGKMNTANEIVIWGNFLGGQFELSQKPLNVLLLILQFHFQQFIPEK